MGKIQIIALAVLVIGNLVLIGRPAQWALGKAELFTLTATLLWAMEAVVAKRIMGDVSARVAALGRMGFGSIAMLIFLAFTGRIDTLVTMGGVQWGWVALTSVFLTGYVAGYYGALKHAPATLVASVLVLGSVITSLLFAIFNARTFTVAQVAGFVLVFAATALWFYVGSRFVKSPMVAQEVANAGR